MNPLQIVPSAKIVAIQVPGNFDQRFVLCYSASMGYYIAEYPNPEDIVICTESRARRMAGTFDTNSRILYIDRGGQEGLVYVGSSEVMEMKMAIKGPKGVVQESADPERTRSYTYMLVNEDGDYLRFASVRGYYIDPNGPHSHVVKLFDEDGANALILDLVTSEFKNLNGDVVDSNLSVHVRGI